MEEILELLILLCDFLFFRLRKQTFECSSFGCFCCITRILAFNNSSFSYLLSIVVSFKSSQRLFRLSRLKMLIIVFTVPSQLLKELVRT